MVDPGYALDCCGNDLVVPCPTELDVPKLVREWRARKTGYDCGPPCDDDNAKGQTQLFCLYVRYCEQDADPVLQYGQDECAEPACEATRTYEGYRFEIDCEREPVPAEDLVTRVKECLAQGVGKEHDETIAILQAECGRWSLPEEALEKAQVRDQLMDLWSKLKAMRGAPGAAQAPYTQLRAFSLLARLGQRTADDSGVEPVVEDLRQRLDELRNARGLNLGDQALVAAARRFPSTLGSSVPSAEPALAAEITAATLIPEQLAAALSSLRGALLAQVRALGITDPRVDRLATLGLQPPSPNADPNRWPESLAQLGNLLQWALDAVQKACLCKALHPPCPPCEDLRVLLACFKFDFDRCEVRDLCSLVRTFVLAPRTVRYWVPWITAFGNQLRDMCCDTECATDTRVAKLLGGGLPTANVMAALAELVERSKPGASHG